MLDGDGAVGVQSRRPAADLGARLQPLWRHRLARRVPEPVLGEVHGADRELLAGLDVVDLERRVGPVEVAALARAAQLRLLPRRQVLGVGLERARRGEVEDPLPALLAPSESVI